MNTVREKEYTRNVNTYCLAGGAYAAEVMEEEQTLPVEQGVYEETQRGDFDNEKNRVVYCAFKRLFDIVCSFFALVVLSPVFLIVAIAVKIDDPKGPVIFKQLRVGKKGKQFYMYKFRSMCADAEAMIEHLYALNERDGPAFKIENDPRVTRVGKIIRKTCIDELPQLVNIFNGNMSIVGPRPPLVTEVAEYNDYQMQRLSVTPGLTCIWQIQKGEETTFDEWVEMDLEYIRNRSLALDLKLIFKTIFVVLTGRGAK